MLPPPPSPQFDRFLTSSRFYLSSNGMTGAPAPEAAFMLLCYIYFDVHMHNGNDFDTDSNGKIRSLLLPLIWQTEGNRIIFGSGTM